MMITVVYQLCTLLISSKPAVRRQGRTGFNTTVKMERAEGSVLQETSETFDIKKDCLAVVLSSGTENCAERVPDSGDI